MSSAYKGLRADSWLQIRKETRELPLWRSWSLIGHLISWRPDCPAALSYLRDYLNPNHFCSFHSLPAVMHWSSSLFTHASGCSFNRFSLSLCHILLRTCHNTIPPFPLRSCEGVNAARFDKQDARQKFIRTIKQKAIRTTYGLCMWTLQSEVTCICDQLGDLAIRLISRGTTSWHSSSLLKYLVS